MAYIGAEPLPGQNREVDDISSSFNGSTTAFTLQVSGVNVSPESANNILVNIGGVIQNPGTDYTIAASTITFTTAPASGLSFFALILGAGINTATVADQTIGTSKVLDNAITADKLAHTSVTAGSYTTADITVDAQGRITAAANGTIAEAEIANNAVTTNKIANDAVTFSKMQDTANGVRFLGKHDSGGGEIGEITAAQARTMINVADGANQTTINTNADNRVITGSGTANTLNGESGLTYDGNNFNVSAGAHDSGMAITAANNSQETQFSIIGKHSDGTSHTFRLNAKRSANRLDIEGGGSPRISVDANGYVGINQSAPTSELQIGGGTNPSSSKPTVHIAPSSGDAILGMRGGSPTIAFDVTSGGNPRILTDGATLTISSGTLDNVGTDRFKITAGGHFYARGGAGSYISNTGSYHQFVNTGNGQWTMQIKQEHHNGMNTQMLVNSVTNIEAFQIYSTSNNTTRFRVLNNGNCANANNSFGSLSDVKLKENIVDANSQWDDVKAVKVRNFNFKNDKDTKLLGVVAQEVETVSSGLIFETIDRDPDDSTKEIGTTKNVKYSILYMKAFKALQEAMAKIEVLETKVAALEAA